jgi:hypothetical protein
VSAVKNLRVPSNAGKLSSGYTAGGPRVVLKSTELGKGFFKWYELLLCT